MTVGNCNWAFAPNVNTNGCYRYPAYYTIRYDGNCGGFQPIPQPTPQPTWVPEAAAPLPVFGIPTLPNPGVIKRAAALLRELAKELPRLRRLAAVEETRKSDTFTTNTEEENYLEDRAEDAQVEAEYMKRLAGYLEGEGDASNVEFWGADPLGQEDSTEAVQNCVNANRGNVNVGAEGGEYRTTKAIKFGGGDRDGDIVDPSGIVVNELRKHYQKRADEILKECTVVMHQSSETGEEGGGYTGTLSYGDCKVEVDKGNAVVRVFGSDLDIDAEADTELEDTCPQGHHKLDGDCDYMYCRCSCPRCKAQCERRGR